MYFKFTKLADEKWLRKEILTKSMRQIAEEIGSSYSAITHMVRKYGIVVPHRLNHRKSNKPVWNKGKHPEYVQGPNHPNWRGGRQKLSSGYVYVWAPTNPNASKLGYVMEHRLVIEKAIGRYLTKREAVHHINGIKNDNRLENLQLMDSHEENTKLHFQSHKENIILKEEIAELKAEIARLKAQK